MKCWECNINPSDNQPRTFLEKSTGKVYHGTRNFCCDKCENDYCNKMQESEPIAYADFVRM